jgi:tetratricopeptide (TPR) repeat protein
MVFRHESILIRLALLAACAGQPMWCGEHWISVSTAHFEMYTPNGKRDAERSLQGFEQVRYFFLQNSNNKQAPEGRVRIIAFSSEKAFQPFRPNAGTFAYYQQSHERDYIVMQDIDPEHHAAAVHEYTHLIIQHLKLKAPLWLEEGMAEVYSSLEPKGAQAMIGRPPASDWITVNNRPFLDWTLLFGVDHNSPYYNQPDKMQVFYAQSWALTHMLLLGDGYRPGFQKFLAAVNSGMPTVTAFENVYGKSVTDIRKDVERYLHRNTVTAALFDVKLSKAEIDPEFSELSPFQKELALADLLSNRPQTEAEAQQRMLALERQHPASIELQESMGYLAWQRHNTQEAVKHFELAVSQGSQNPNMIFQYAGLLQAAHAPSEDIAKLLQQVLTIQPENLDARLFLADTELERRRYANALVILSPIHTVSPDQAYRFFAISALAKGNLKDYSDGKELALKALKYAETPEQRFGMTGLVEFIDAAVDRNATRTAVSKTTTPEPALPSPASSGEKPPGGLAHSPYTPTTLRRSEGLPRVQGKTKAFECRQGAYRLHVQVGNREMIFAMPDLQDIVVRNTVSGTVDWSCGPLKPLEITVVYKPTANGTAAGSVSELIF